MNAQPKFTNVIYCEDVRKEDNGKKQYIGIYSGDMFVSQTPAIVPKFFIVFSIVRSTDDPVKSFEAEVTFQDKKLAEMQVDEKKVIESTQGQIENRNEIAKWIEKTDPPNEPEPNLYRIDVEIGISPFEITEEGVVRLKLSVNGDRLITNVLTVRQNPDSK